MCWTPPSRKPPAGTGGSSKGRGDDGRAYLHSQADQRPGRG
nr:MAG TPA: hypothetical protein [Caudoviricetes sp.]